MARTGLSRSQVKACRDRLVADGRYPSVDAIRAALGNTGSKSTIHRLLKELEGEEGGAGIPRTDTAQALHGLVEQLADRLHDDAERRIAALREGYEAALRARDAELDGLRAAVARLAARVHELEGTSSAETTGFGDFRALLANPRGGRRDASPFSIVLASGRSDVFEVEKLRPSALKLQ
jgi:hypothetical protein